MADRELRVDVKTTGDPSGVNAVTAAINAQKAAADAASTAAVQGAGAAKTAIDAQTQAQKALAETASETTPGAEGVESTASPLNEMVETIGQVVEGTDKATKSTSNMGQAAMNAAYFFDDLQYGMRGIVNNIPQLLLGLGVSGGLTGIISILAVGLNQLIPKLGGTGDAAKDATPELAALAVATRLAAEASAEQERKINAGREALRLHNQKLEDAEDAYRRLKTSIEETTQARERLNRTILAETDADAALRLTKIEGSRLRGDISDTEAETQSGEVRREAEGKHFEVLQSELRARREALQSEADELRRKANADFSAARDVEATGSGILTAEARKSIADLIKNLNAGLDILAAESAKLPTTVSMFGVPQANPARMAMGDRIQKKIDEIMAQQSLLNRDDATKAATGLADTEAVRQEVERLKKQAQAAVEEAGAKDRAQAALTDEEKRGTRIFSLSRERDKEEEGNKITVIQSRENQQREKERQEAERDKERESRQQERDSRSAGRDVAGAVRDFSKGRSGGRIRELTDKANTLKDGIDAGELDGLGNALRALAGTINAKSSADRKALQEIWKAVATLKKQSGNNRE